MCVLKRSSIIPVVIKDDYHLPFSNMKDSWWAHDKCLKFVLQAVVGYMLKAPVPIVVVKRTEGFCTVIDFVPHRSVECHSHVVLAAQPRCLLYLHNINKRNHYKFATWINIAFRAWRNKVWESSLHWKCKSFREDIFRPILQKYLDFSAWRSLTNRKKDKFSLRILRFTSK